MAYAGKAGEAPPISRPYYKSQNRPSRATAALVTGLTVGLLVGAGVALLFAPQDGLETRRNIKRRLRRVGGRSRDAWDGLRNELWRARRRARRARRARRRRELEVAEQNSSI